RRILEPQDEPTVGRDVIGNGLQPGDALPQRGQDVVEAVHLPLAQILQYVAEVVSRLRQPALGAYDRHAAPPVGSEVLQVQTGDESSACFDSRMLFELAESVDRQDVCGTEHLRAAPTLLLVVHLTGAHLEIKNMPWLSLRGGSGPPQPFPRDHGTARGIVV